MKPKLMAVALVALFSILLVPVMAQGRPATVMPAQESGLSPIEQLGKALFFDTSLSSPPGQSCATCHAPEVGWTGPDQTINAAGAVYQGAVHGRFGDRKPPASAYGDAPVLHWDEDEGAWVGGVFWDGRAAGWRLGDPLAEQAQGPFLNPLEQNMPGAKQVCLAVKRTSYSALFEQVWGPGSLDCVKDVNGTYERIARSIAEYERSDEVNPYTSKFDSYLRGETDLTEQELLGLTLFESEKAHCSNCHTSAVGEDGSPPVFTAFDSYNLGVPRNPDNPFYTMPRKWNPAGADFVDYGLGGFLRSAGFSPEVYEPELSRFRIPTLRNVDLRPHEDFVKAYGHNGYFKSLEEIVHFYNTRDVPGAGWNGEPWPAPEVALNVNRKELGNLGLTAEEEAAIVAFLRTLSDGWVGE
jgi:cytochrome c peroxidase